MESFLLSLVQPFPLLLLLLSLHFLFRAFLRKRKLPFPPGPTRLPIIGNLLMMDQMTHRGLAKLAQKYGGLVYLRLGVLHTLAICTPDMAREVLQVQDHVFSNRAATIAVQYLTYDRADMAFAHCGPFWRQIRKVCVMKLFSRKRAESWASVRDSVESTLQTVSEQAGSPVNIGELVFELMRTITYRAAFGSDSEEGQKEYLSIIQETSKLMGAINIADFIPWLGFLDLQGFNNRMKITRESLDKFIDKIIDDHMEKQEEKREEDKDMIDELIAFLEEVSVDKAGLDDLQKSFRLTRDNIKAIIWDVMFGGTETVASVIEWTMSELLNNPEELKKVQGELGQVVGFDRKVHESDLDNLPYLKCVTKETLRLHPPIPLMLHETADDCEIGGYSVPVGTRVMINAWAIGRDKDAWEDAEKFKPSRFEKEGAPDFRGNYFELVPFGSGRRSCPGMQLGLYALELAVAQFLHCFTWELPDGMKPWELDMSDDFGLSTPKAQRLVAVPTPRLHCPLF
ncbi:cytochrome P450 84A1-like [Tasmannia lanceolata]|uniref:cytochrome P450 84A1-like n=1 Tax=Tasmannia lanceolata TaxID=3420 RepID=UPI004063BC44